MTREEILKQGKYAEPNCFETGREEQWYRVGLYEGATASPWHKVADGDLPKVAKDCIFRCKGICIQGFMCWNKSLSLEGEPDSALCIYDIDYWMEIPKLPSE